MEDVNSMLDGEMDRRTFVATAASIGLAGCGGKGDEQTQSTGNSTETSQEQTGNSEKQPSETDTQQAQDYPQKEPVSDVESRTFSSAEENESEYAFKIDDLNYINNPELESSQEGVKTYIEALDVVLNSETDGEDCMILYFTKPSEGAIEFLRNTERSFNEYVKDKSSTSKGWSDEFGEDVRGTGGADPELSESEYAEFLSEYVDGDGIVNHAGDIPEYAQEALESGWQA